MVNKYSTILFTGKEELRGWEVRIWWMVGDTKINKALNLTVGKLKILGECAEQIGLRSTFTYQQ